MAYVDDKKEVGGGFRNEIKKMQVRYDFGKDGGAIGVLDMLDVKADMVLHKALIKVKTACTSAGSATVIFGIKGGDTDLILDATDGAVANLTANAVIEGDSATAEYVRIAAGAVISMEIGTAALTAGVIDLELLYTPF